VALTLPLKLGEEVKLAVADGVAVKLAVADRVDE
jgi:hypothetical protein